MELTFHGINDAYPAVLKLLLDRGVSEPSRNGPVITLPEPLMVTYTNPMDRVLFDYSRNENPFFHLLGDALHLLAGRQDVAWQRQFVASIGRYSDDGEKFNGAYGWRLRHHFGVDQIEAAAARLAEDPHTRRAVVAMWDPFTDSQGHSLDYPCNLGAMFRVRDSIYLDMTVMNRSNDVLWGMLGANVVQFSVLLEYMAAKTGFPMGHYTQITNNAHWYGDKESLQRHIENIQPDKVEGDRVPLVGLPRRFDGELQTFLHHAPGCGQSNFEEEFFRHVAYPMLAGWYDHKNGIDAMPALSRIKDPYWRWACINWYNKRTNKT